VSVGRKIKKRRGAPRAEKLADKSKGLPERFNFFTIPMRSATYVFLALAFANVSATTSNPTRGDDRRYADALEELEREMVIGDGGGVRKAGGARGDAGRSRSTTPTTASLHRHRLDTDDQHTGYKSHQLWKEEKKEGLEAARRRVSEKLADHREGRETLGERDLAHLSRRMAALERKMISVDGETPERVSPERTAFVRCELLRTVKHVSTSLCFCSLSPAHYYHYLRMT
jgi:hypothetical protein